MIGDQTAVDIFEPHFEYASCQVVMCVLIHTYVLDSHSWGLAFPCSVRDVLTKKGNEMGIDIGYWPFLSSAPTSSTSLPLTLKAPTPSSASPDVVDVTPPHSKPLPLTSGMCTQTHRLINKVVSTKGRNLFVLPCQSATASSLR